MSFWKRLFGAEKSQTSSPFDGFQVFDARSNEVRRQEEALATDATLPLSGEDEQIAVKLLHILAPARNRVLTDLEVSELRTIGEYLNANGGMHRMKRVWFRVNALGGNSRSLEQRWDHIGEWLG